VLAPTVAPAKITDATPADGATASRGTPISVRMEDFSTTVTLSTVKLFVDTVDVTGQANPTKPADVTTMSYLPSGGWVAYSTHTYIVQFTDSAAAVTKVTNTFSVNALGAPGQFVIEMEDFNYGVGLTLPAASTMPYLGLAYAGLDAVLNVDYMSQNADQRGGGYVPAYRSTATNAVIVQGGHQVCLNENGGAQLDRGTWTLTDNYKIGWAGGGAWYNYTRTIPAATYTVYAALSYGDTPQNQPHGCTAVLDLVTSGATTTSQTLVRLGSFDGPATGGWGANALIPLLDGTGAATTVNLGGTQTLRVTQGSGDEDYFVLVPGATPVSPAIATGPTNQTVTSGSPVTFTVVATGTGPLTYQWNFKGGALLGQTNATFNIASADSGKAGNYSVTVTGPAVPPATSTDAILTVSASQPQFTSVTVNPDKSITLVWTGTGTLEVTTSLKSPITWTPVTTAASPYTFTPDPANGPVMFGRIHGL